jgi:hypothetical protein
MQRRAHGWIKTHRGEVGEDTDRRHDDDDDDDDEDDAALCGRSLWGHLGEVATPPHCVALTRHRPACEFVPFHAVR